MSNGYYITPFPDIYLNLSGGTVTGGTNFIAGLSGSSIFSGSTDLYDIFQTQGTDLNKTYIQDGLNTYTGGTSDFPTVNISGLTIEILTVSGATDLGVLSADTIYSGSTNLYSIFQIQGSDTAHTNVQPGLNTYTGGTENAPAVNISAATLDTLSVSGISILTTADVAILSADTMISGTTNLYDIFQTTADGNDITRVQPGTNIYTGGTANAPTVNISAATLDTLAVSGNTDILGLDFRDIAGEDYILVNKTLYISGASGDSLLFAGFPDINFQSSFVLESTSLFQGVATFDRDLKFTNSDSSGISSLIVTASTDVRNWTLPDKTGTIALLSDSASTATYIQNGLNVYTGGTPQFPTVNISAATLDMISVTGTSTLTTINAITLSATTLSAGTMISGTTNLYSIFPTFINLGNYLPLTGGTMSGNISMQTNDLMLSGDSFGSGRIYWNENNYIDTEFGSATKIVVDTDFYIEASLDSNLQTYLTPGQRIYVTNNTTGAYAELNLDGGGSFAKFRNTSSSNFGQLLSPTMTTLDRVWTLPDATGTIALVSNITSAITSANYLPLTGGTMSGGIAFSDGSDGIWNGDNEYGRSGWQIDFFNSNENLNFSLDGGDYYFDGGSVWFSNDINSESISSNTFITILTPSHIVYIAPDGSLTGETGFEYNQSTNVFNVPNVEIAADGYLTVGSGGTIIGYGGTPGVPGVGDLVVHGNFTLFGESFSAHTEQLYIEDNLITLNYNPTASTISTSKGSGFEVQDGSGIQGTYVFWDIRGTGNTLSERSFTTNLYEIRVQETGTTSSPAGLRVLVENDVLYGGDF